VRHFLLLLLFVLLCPQELKAQEGEPAEDTPPADDDDDSADLGDDDDSADLDDDDDSADPVPTPIPQPGVPSVHERMVITATGEPRLLSDSPIPVRLIDEETLRRSSAADAGELLRQVPGVPIMTSGAEHRGGGSGVSLQGVPAGRTAILLDGRPIVGDVGGVVDLSQFPSSMLERIEIVEGPMSALYGSDALGGVVNLITRKPAPGVQLSHRFSVASDGAVSAAITQSAAVGDFSWGATANLTHSAPVRLDPSSEGTDLDQRTAAGIRFFAALRRAKNRVELTALYHHDARRGTIERTNQAIQHSALYDTPKRHDRFTGNLSWRHRFSDKVQGRWELDFTDYSFRLDEDLRGSPVFSQRNARASKGSGRFRVDLALLPFATAIAGVEGGRETLSIIKNSQAPGGVSEQLIEVAPTDEWSIEPWVQGDFRLFAGRLEIVPGLRLSINESYGFAAAPSLAVRINLWEGAALRISGGRGYRAPSLKDRFLVFDHASLGYIVYGNPDLRPESSWGANLSLEQQISDKGSLRIGGFAHRLTDLITFVYDGASSSDGLNVYRSTNVEGARSVGAQATLDLRFDWVRFTAAYRFVWAWSDTGFFLPDTSVHGLKTTVEFDIRKFNARVYTAVGWESDRYVDAGQDVRSPGAVLWDVRLEKEFPKASDLAIFIEVDNLLDQHRDPTLTGDLRPVRGRRVLGGVRGTLRFAPQQVEK
jgi:outer membrane receptor for ferrienterochelin and colicins